MHRLRVAVVLLLVAAACAPGTSAGTAEDPELTDEAGDQQIQRTVPQQVPGIPGVTDDEFDDVDIVAAWWQQGRTDCVGAAAGTCPSVALVVATTATWNGGTLTATFRLERGPTSYAESTASGQSFTITVAPDMAVTGLANATAANQPDGLRITLPLPRLGGVGGDLLTGLNLSATRTSLGLITDPQATQDDASGSDAAGPGAAYMLERPAPVAGIDVSVAQVGAKAGNALTVNETGSYAVRLRLVNTGTDADAFTVAITSDPPLAQPPQAPAAGIALARGEVATVDVAVPLGADDVGTTRVTFTVTTQRGASDTAFAVLVLEPEAAQREVVPAGLDFLTPAAESAGLDDAFGKYAELVLLALIVLLVILASFLLVALAPSTLAGTAAPEAPPVGAGESAPAGVLAGAAAGGAVAATQGGADEGEVEGPSGAPAGAAAAPLAIESVTHEPEAPEEGEVVRTEVVVRNPGPTRQVRIVLSLDERDEDERAVTLPARATKTVRLGWVAGPGENKVRVRVLPA